MRIPRFLQLFEPSASAHMYLRCHNKEYYLRDPRHKKLYLDAAKESLKKAITDDKVSISAYCLMDNHIHMCVQYDESANYLSRYMRHAHSLFGARYNRLNDRSGKVAESRPKTALIQDWKHEIQVHFYIEANPIRAGICTAENLKLYRYNSHKLYAYGICDEYTAFVKIPEWYFELGSTNLERQKKYRELFYAYLRAGRSKHITPLYSQKFIGSVVWALQQEKRISDFLRFKRENSS